MRTLDALCKLEEAVASLDRTKCYADKEEQGQGPVREEDVDSDLLNRGIRPWPQGEKARLACLHLAREAEGGLRTEHSSESRFICDSLYLEEIVSKQRPGSQIQEPLGWACSMQR